jgi:heme/copper-type cytochrome/quinol oxidase subunit 2
MKDFIKKGLEKIKSEKIKPVAKWKFEARNFFWWTALVASVLAGGISVSILVFLVSELDWQIYNHLGDSFLETFLIMFPHFWLIFLAVFMVISYENLRHTKKGYHYELFVALGVIMTSSLVFGAFLYFSGLNQKLNRIFSDAVPGYLSVIHTKEDQWSQPEKGLLSGKIILQEKIADTDVLVIETFKKEDWKVFITKDTFVKGAVELKEGEIIKVIGKQKQEKNQFEATEIRPWEGMGRGRGR